MNYKFIGKNIEVTNSIKNYAEKALSKLDKYFEKKDVECRVTLRTYKVGTKAEITIIVTQNTILRAEVKNDDLYAAIDLSVDKLTGQIRKLKTKLKKRLNNKEILFNNVETYESEDTNKEIFIKNKTITPEVMNINDAILNMEALCHSFYIYIDEDNNNLSVVYKREDGNYGSIEVLCKK